MKNYFRRVARIAGRVVKNANSVARVATRAAVKAGKSAARKGAGR